MLLYFKDIFNKYKLLKLKLEKITKENSFNDIFEYFIFYIIFMFLVIFYVRFFFKWFFLIYFLWFFFFLIFYIIGKNINLNTKFNFLNSIKPTNLLVFIIYNFLVRLPIIITYLIFYNNLSIFFKKSNSNFFIFLKSYLLKLLFNLIFNIPFFVLNASYNMLNVYIRQRKLNKLLNNRSVLNLIYDFINNYTLSTIGYYILIVNQLNIKIISRFNVELNPKPKDLNPDTLNKFLVYFIRNSDIRAITINAAKTEKYHITNINPLKNNRVIKDIFKEDDEKIVSAINFTTKDIVPNNVPIHIKGEGYASKEHGTTPDYFAKVTDFRVIDSKKAMYYASEVLNEPKQMIMLAFSVAYNYDKFGYKLVDGVLVPCNESLKSVSKKTNGEVYEDDNKNEALYNLDITIKNDPTIFNNLNEKMYRNNMIANFFKANPWFYSDHHNGN